MIDVMEKAHPRMKYVWFIRACLGLIVIAVFLIPTMFTVLLDVSNFFTTFISIAILIIIVYISIAAIWSWLYYRFYSYAIKDDVVLIRRGILFRRRVTIPYERIQNVSVSRSPLLLIFGLSSVQIETAGGAGLSAFRWTGSPYMAEGVIHGVINGETFADELIKRVKSTKSGSGMGN